jgi:hypothetical protein
LRIILILLVLILVVTLLFQENEVNFLVLRIMTVERVTIQFIPVPEKMKTIWTIYSQIAVNINLILIALLFLGKKLVFLALRIKMVERNTTL